MSDVTAISVLVRTFNSAKTLDQLIAGLSVAEDDEIIVVDSGSSDATPEIAGRHQAVIVRPPPPFHYSKSLNYGFRAAKNPWVLVISSHCVPVVPNFLEIYRREVARLPADVVVGYAPSTLSGESDPKLDRDRTTIFEPQDYSRVSHVCGNGNTIYRRSAWEELPFDETIRTAEDKLWIIEMTRRRHRFAYLPGPRGLNKNQASLAYMFRKGYRDARALRSPGHRPMTPWQLAGALKNLTLPKLRGEISWANWLRYGAHILGQFFASYRSEDNAPKDGAS